MEEDDIDIEGDFDLKPTTVNDACDDDLPSNSAHLQPEFTQDPWVLEQGWSLGYSIDEKSKAAIERMLQEEQFYVDGKPTDISMPVISPTRPPNKPSSHKKQWTQEEKDLFFKGLDIFGHSWIKISSIIPTRSSQQVKYFAQQHMKQKAKSSLLTNQQSRVSQSVQQMLLSVTTGQPTIAGVVPKAKKQRRDNACRKQRHSELRKEDLTKGETGLSAVGGVTVSHSLEVIRLNKVSESSSDEEIDVTDDASTGWTDVNSGLADGHPNSDDSHTFSVQENHAETRSSDSHPDPGVTPVYPESYGTCLVRGEDATVNPDETDGTSPAHSDDVAEKYAGQCVGDNASIGSLVGLFDAPDAGCLSVGKFCGCSSADKHALCCHNSISKNYSEIDPFLNQSTCRKICSDQSVGCSHSDWINPSSPRCPVPGVDVNISCLPDKAKLIQGEACNLGEQALSSGTEQGLGDTCERECTPVKTHCDESSDAIAVSPSEEVTYTSVVELADPGALAEHEDAEEHLNEYAVLTSTGDIVYMANPTAEVVLVPRDISDQEKVIHSEFFDNRPGLKTSDRYLRIRTFIIDSWRRCKPNYLTKTSVRPGLRNCGDVNCIGRIHSYLEQLGAINFGCSQVQFNRPVKAMPMKVVKVVTSEEQRQYVMAERLAIIHARKRRVRDEHGNWVDEGDLEGKTIRHDNMVSENQQKPSKSTKVRRLYDPFLMTPCESFSSSHPAPFHVVIEYSGLLTMDVHAHLSKTEVIGLLGGEYSEERGVLHVTTAEPCDSISTGMQCDMDPVSQTEASDAIRSVGQAVVGWYHSHPTFAPNPSVRDLETQHKFQDWFAKGGCPFIGVIVNPYDKRTPSHHSLFKCLIVCSNDAISPPAGSTGVPYEFDFESSHSRWNDDAVMTHVTQLSQTYRSYLNRVHLLEPMIPMTDITFLDKILQSVEMYLPEEHKADPNRQLTNAISNTIRDTFVNTETSTEHLSESDLN